MPWVMDDDTAAAVPHAVLHHDFCLMPVLFDVLRCYIRMVIRRNGSLQRSLRCRCWLSRMPIELFQRNAASPWTITHRPFENNVHKICYAVLPLLAFLRLINPGPAGVTLGVTFLLSSLMSQVSDTTRVRLRDNGLGCIFLI